MLSKHEIEYSLPCEINTVVKGPRHLRIFGICCLNNVCVNCISLLLSDSNGVEKAISH